MLIARVIGHVWATKKDEKLNGLKFLVVRTKDGNELVAADAVGAGIGEDVLVSQGSSGRVTFEAKNMPVDSVIVGIIDSVEVDKKFIEQ